MPTPDLFTRHPDNPIVQPGLHNWRRATVFNPAALLDDDGKVYLWERAAGELRPFRCHLGLLVSDDGVHFTHVRDEPVFTPADCGSEYGSVQDPRIVKIDGRYLITFAYRPFAWSSHPTGIGVPYSHETDFPGVARADYEEGKGGSANVQGGRPDNLTRSGIAESFDRETWRLLGWVTDDTLDDRNVILFPEKINGRYAILRRPLQLVGDEYGTPGPAIWLSYSDDLTRWTPPVLVAPPMFGWEDNRVGGSAPPIKTPHGWLTLYHAVQTEDEATKRVVYRVGAMLLDLDDPTRVLARTPEPIFEPEAYYERVGLYIPNVVFPTAAIVKDGLVYMYYGVCDTAIALATCPLNRLLEHVLQFREGA